MSTTQPLRVAVLGTGAIAQIVHLPILTSLPGVRVEGVCDVDDAKARTLANRLGIPRVFERDEDVFASDDVDAVLICSPNHLHQEQVVAGLESGKHVLVERPLAMDPKGAEAAVRAAERADRTLMVAYNNRYRPDTRELRSFITGGELGEIYSVRGTWFNRKYRPKRTTWRHRKASSGGGALMDLGVQVLDLCLWMLDYPPVDTVCAHVHPGERMEVEDAAAVLLRLENGATLSMDVTWSFFGERDRHHVRVFGTAGSGGTEPLTVFKDVEHGTFDVTPPLRTSRENAYTASYREQLKHFAAAALGAGAPLPTDQVDLMRIIARAYESAEKGKELRV